MFESDCFIEDIYMVCMFVPRRFRLTEEHTEGISFGPLLTGRTTVTQHALLEVISEGRAHSPLSTRVVCIYDIHR